jgi:KDO2-lipid IV(A) lauroyltransferase
VKNILEYILFVLLSYLCRLIGLKLSRKFSSLIALFFFYLLPIRKDVVFDNLKHAFPQLSDEEIRKIALASYKSFTLTLVEILYLPWMSKEEISDVIKFEKLNLILEKEKENNGVILLSAHFGNWEYCAIGAGILLNKKFSVVVKSQRNILLMIG